MFTYVTKREIAEPPARVFARLADLGRYSEWLPPSATFGRIILDSSQPPERGMTYIDQSKTTGLPGVITEYVPPTRLAFHQEMRGIFGRMSVTIVYTLTATGTGTSVARQQETTTTGLFTLFQPLLKRTLRAEQIRIMRALDAPYPAENESTGR